MRAYIELTLVLVSTTASRGSVGRSKYVFVSGISITSGLPFRVNVLCQVCSKRIERANVHKSGCGIAHFAECKCPRRFVDGRTLIVVHERRVAT